MGRSQIAVITSKYTFLIFFCGIICKLKNDSYLCSALREKHYLTVVLERWQSGRSVSYTHLTLPTICSV